MIPRTVKIAFAADFLNMELIPNLRKGWEKDKTKASKISLLKFRLSQHVCQACEQTLPEPQDTSGSWTANWKLKTENFTHISSFSQFLYKCYVVVTYQLHTHICNSCKRYVVVTYRSILFTPCKKHVFYTCNSDVPIQIGTEQIHNKQIITYFPDCLFTSLKGATLISNLRIYYINPPF